jgi:hypothetical protein
MLLFYNFKKDQARMSESQATIQAAESARKKQQNYIAVLTTAALIFVRSILCYLFHYDS